SIHFQEDIAAISCEAKIDRTEVEPEDFQHLEAFFADLIRQPVQCHRHRIVHAEIYVTFSKLRLYFDCEQFLPDYSDPNIRSFVDAFLKQMRPVANLLHVFKITVSECQCWDPLGNLEFREAFPCRFVDELVDNSAIAAVVEFCYCVWIVGNQGPGNIELRIL